MAQDTFFYYLFYNMRFLPWWNCSLVCTMPLWGRLKIVAKTFLLKSLNVSLLSLGW